MGLSDDLATVQGALKEFEEARETGAVVRLEARQRLDSEVVRYQSAIEDVEGRNAALGARAIEFARQLGIADLIAAIEREVAPPSVASEGQWVHSPFFSDEVTTPIPEEKITLHSAPDLEGAPSRDIAEESASEPAPAVNICPGFGDELCGKVIGAKSKRCMRHGMLAARSTQPKMQKAIGVHSAMAASGEVTPQPELTIIAPESDPTPVDDGIPPIPPINVISILASRYSLQLQEVRSRAMNDPSCVASRCITFFWELEREKDYARATPRAPIGPIVWCIGYAPEIKNPNPEVIQSLELRGRDEWVDVSTRELVGRYCPDTTPALFHTGTCMAVKHSTLGHHK
jgi:hypothetical protein